jgi:hypothetical protein
MGAMIPMQPVGAPRSGVSMPPTIPGHSTFYYGYWNLGGIRLVMDFAAVLGCQDRLQDCFLWNTYRNTVTLRPASK